MANGDDSFSTYMDMLRAFHTRRFAAARESIEQENRAVPPSPLTASPPPRATNLGDDRNQSLINSLRSTSLTPQETETCLKFLTNVMTSSEDEDDAVFQEVISKLNGSELQRMASLLTSNSDHYFLEMVRNKNGSKRVRTLFGKSDDADSFFIGSILRHFFYVMTNKEASYAAIHGMRVFNQEKKMQMYDQILHHVIPLACNQYGCVRLKTIISDDDFVYCTNYLLGIVAFNALLLSYDAYGTFVVQHVLKLNNLRCTYVIAVRLRGHYVELSFTHGGRYIVESLLEREETGVLVVAELLECGRDKLVKLAKSVHGNYVVVTALRVTRGYSFRALVNKLKRFLPLLRMSHQSITIVEILESVR